MFEKTNYIELSGEKYPIKCDILVLERIQVNTRTCRNLKTG